MEETMLKYQPMELKKTEDITPEVITSFVSAYSDGELAPTLKYDPEPTSPAPSDVPVLALNTYTFETVFSEHPDKDILVFFAGPACFNCEAVWPGFERTVRALREGSTSLLFAYVDLTYNELQETAKVYSFPTLRLYPVNPEEPGRRALALNYEGQPDYHSFKAFLEENVKGGPIVADPR